MLHAPLIDDHPVAASRIADFSSSTTADGASRTGDRASPILFCHAFEPELCRLIQYYEDRGGKIRALCVMSMARRSARTTTRTSAADQDIENGTENPLHAPNSRSLIPEIQKAYQFKATRMERYIVAATKPHGGHFRAHRHNSREPLTGVSRFRSS